MKVVSTWILVILLGGCGGDAFSSSEALSLSPDSGAFDDSQGPPASDGDSRWEAAGPVAPDSLGPGESEAASRDVLRDPWPDDVVVEPAPDGPPACVWGSAAGCPCTNCWLFDRPDGTTDHIICCGAFTMAGEDASARQPSSANLCGEGGFPTNHKAYCDSCACHL